MDVAGDCLQTAAKQNFGLGTQRRVGSEHAMVAMAMYAGRWHQGIISPKVHFSENSWRPKVPLTMPRVCSQLPEQ